MNNSDRIWLSRESFETLCNALQNIQIRQDLSIFSPRITFSGSGKTSSLFLDLPPSSRASSGEYMSYFKIVDRSDTIEQEPDVTYDKRMYKIAVCDGGTYDAEKGTSGRSIYYLNNSLPPSVWENAFPYRESELFTAQRLSLYVQIKMVVQLDIGEGPEGGSGENEEEKFVPEYKVIVTDDPSMEINSYDYNTGKLTCICNIGRVSFPEYSFKRVSELKIIQDHLTGPLHMFWYISCKGSEEENGEEEA